MKLKFLIQFCLLIILIAGCESNGKEGGGTETGDPGASAEITKGLIGGKTVLDKNSNISVENVTLWIDDNGSQKIFSRENGNFLIENLSLGEHTIYARWKENDILLMGKSEVFEIGIPKKLQKPFIYLGQSIILTDPANVTGMVVSNSLDVTVMLNKTIFKTKVSSNGVFELNEIPAGTYILEFLQGNRKIFSQEIELNSGETLDLGLIDLN